MRQQEQVIIITPDGRVRFVWDDALAGLLEEGKANVLRAGEVEPTPEGKWMADCRLSGGSVHGPFTMRQTALEVERQEVTALLMQQ